MKSWRRVQRGVAATAIVLALAPAFAMSSFAGTGTPLDSSSPSTPGSVNLTSDYKALNVSWNQGSRWGDHTSSSSTTYTASAVASGSRSGSCSTQQLYCTIHGLSNGVLYTVTVVATNSTGSSQPSMAVTGVDGVPPPPNQVRAIAGTAMATIGWAPPRPSAVARITGFMATASPGGFSCSTFATALGGPSRTCKIAGLTSGMQYDVTVTATNAYGTGAPSNSASVTPN